MSGGAQEGDLVALEILREGGFGLPSARVVERLGKVDTERAVSQIAIAAHDIPYVFSAAALEEADKAKPASMEKREDWRSLPLVTIDPADAKDHDDAVHAEPDEDPGNPGGFVLTVAIADVAYYVRPGSPLDKEALERGNSVYFPDRVVPMLPERISNDLCSLRAREDRPALAVRMIIGADGRKKRHTFHRIMMRSAAKLAYEQAQAAIDGRTDEITEMLVEPVLKPLWAAYAALKKERDTREPLDLDLPERKLVLDEQGRLKGVRWPERLDAHRLIEECMILANVAAAETLEAQLQPLIYRAHDAPSMEKLNDLGEFLSTLGVKLAKGERMRPSHFNRVIANIRGAPAEALVNEVILRAQSQAEYTHENYGHFGLNLRRYAHFTSPIRRYADLIVHRALIRCAEPRARRDGRRRAERPRRHRRADFRRRTARNGGRTRDAGSADRRASGLAHRRQFQGACRRRHQVRVVCKTRRYGRRWLYPGGDARRRLFPVRRGAARAGWHADRRDVPARRRGRCETCRGGAVRWRASVRNALARRLVAQTKGKTAVTQTYTNAPRALAGNDRSAMLAIRRGFMGRCPHCGEGRMFRAYLKVVDECPVCGEELKHQRADDAPAYVTMLIVGHFIVAGLIAEDELFPTVNMGLVALVWSFATIAVSLLLLPRIKGALVGYQWAMRMHGFGGPEREYV